MNISPTIITSALVSTPSLNMCFVPFTPCEEIFANNSLTGIYSQIPGSNDSNESFLEYLIKGIHSVISNIGLGISHVVNYFADSVSYFAANIKQATNFICSNFLEHLTYGSNSTLTTSKAVASIPSFSKSLVPVNPYKDTVASIYPHIPSSGYRVLSVPLNSKTATDSVNRDIEQDNKYFIERINLESWFTTLYEKSRISNLLQISGQYSVNELIDAIESIHRPKVPVNSCKNSFTSIYSEIPESSNSDNFIVTPLIADLTNVISNIGLGISYVADYFAEPITQIANYIYILLSEEPVSCVSRAIQMDLPDVTSELILDINNQDIILTLLETANFYNSTKAFSAIVASGKVAPRTLYNFYEKIALSNRAEPLEEVDVSPVGYFANTLTSTAAKLGLEDIESELGEHAANGDLKSVQAILTDYGHGITKENIISSLMFAGLAKQNKAGIINALLNFAGNKDQSIFLGILEHADSSNKDYYELIEHVVMHPNCDKSKALLTAVHKCQVTTTEYIIKNHLLPTKTQDEALAISLYNHSKKQDKSGYDKVLKIFKHLCQYGHFSDKGLLISLKIIQESNNEKAIPIILSLNSPNQLKSRVKDLIEKSNSDSIYNITGNPYSRFLGENLSILSSTYSSGLDKLIFKISDYSHFITGFSFFGSFREGVVARGNIGAREYIDRFRRHFFYETAHEVVKKETAHMSIYEINDYLSGLVIGKGFLNDNIRKIQSVLDQYPEISIQIIAGLALHAKDDNEILHSIFVNKSFRAVDILIELVRQRTDVDTVIRLARKMGLTPIDMKLAFRAISDMRTHMEHVENNNYLGSNIVTIKQMVDALKIFAKAEFGTRNNQPVLKQLPQPNEVDQLELTQPDKSKILGLPMPEEVKPMLFAFGDEKEANICNCSNIHKPANLTI